MYIWSPSIARTIYSGIFNDFRQTQGYRCIFIHNYKRATKEGEGGPSLLFLKIGKNSQIFERKALCPSFKFPIQNVVLRVSRRKNSKCFPAGPHFLVFLTKSLSKDPGSTNLPPYVLFLVAQLHSGIIVFFTKRSILNVWQCSEYFCLNNCSVIWAVTLCYVLHQPSHMMSLSIIKTGGVFKTLWNVDQTYLEPCHRALFSHLQAYSEPRATFGYAETSHTQDPGTFGNIPNSIRTHIQILVVLTKIYEPLQSTKIFRTLWKI